MAVLRGAEQDRYITPGTRVRLAILVNEADEVTPEMGTVIHCWPERLSGRYWCYVAFFGGAFPLGEPLEEPRVIRHPAIALAELGQRAPQRRFG